MSDNYYRTKKSALEQAKSRYQVLSKNLIWVRETLYGESSLIEISIDNATWISTQAAEAMLSQVVASNKLATALKRAMLDKEPANPSSSFRNYVGLTNRSAYGKTLSLHDPLKRENVLLEFGYDQAEVSHLCGADFTLETDPNKVAGYKPPKVASANNAPLEQNAQTSSGNNQNAPGVNQGRGYGNNRKRGDRRK